MQVRDRKRRDMSGERASEIAQATNERVHFIGDSEFGTAYPCGCVVYSTVYENGEVGWGSWTDSCGELYCPIGGVS